MVVSRCAAVAGAQGAATPGAPVVSSTHGGLNTARYSSSRPTGALQAATSSRHTHTTPPLAASPRPAAASSLRACPASRLVVWAAAAAGEVAVAIQPLQQQQQEETEDDEQQQQNLSPDAGEVYDLLHTLHSLCDGGYSSTGQPCLATAEQLHAWAAAAQPHLLCMSLAEVSYVASCLRHHRHLWQQQQQQDQQQPLPVGAGSLFFLASPVFLQHACAAAHTAATTAQHALQDATLQPQQQQQQQDYQSDEAGSDGYYSRTNSYSASSTAAAAEHHHHELIVCLQHLIELLQWAAGEVVQQRQQLLQQLQTQQSGAAAGERGAVQGYRQQLQLQVAAQQQVQQLLAHPLLLAALPHVNCWQLQQLLLCSGQLGQPPSSDWMGRWLAAARHAASDLALPYLHQQDRWQVVDVDNSSSSSSHGPHWQEHVREQRASAASAYSQLVGLLSGLSAAHVKPPAPWAATWEQAALAVLSAQPCFSALDCSSCAGDEDVDTYGCQDSSSSNSFFGMLQQLLQSVSSLGLQLSADFWTAHEGLVQQQLLAFNTAELLRLLQLHQRLNLRPSKACVKYMAAVLEQHLQQQHARRTAAVVLQAQQQQEQQGLTQHAHHQQQEQQLEEEEVQPGFGSSSSGSSASSVDVLQLVMCTCGLSVWGVRLHLRSVAELLVCLEQHKEQLPLTVTLQVLTVLGARLGRVYSLGWAAAAAHGDTSSSSSSSSSSDSSCSMSTLSADGEDLTSAAVLGGGPADSVASVTASATAAAAPTPAATAAAVEALLLHAADKVAALEAAQQQQQQQGEGQTVECGPLLRLLQVCASLARNSSRAGRTTHVSTTTLDSVTTLAAAQQEAAAAAGVADSHAAGMSTGVAFLDVLVHKLHPLCGAAATTCSPQQLVQLMTAWNQLGFSTAWRFGGFRRGYKRLAQQQVLQALSNAELAAAVEAVGKLPPMQSVVQALAAEVMRRQTAQEQQPSAADGSGDMGLVGASGSEVAPGQQPVTAAAAMKAAAQPLSPSQLLTVVCAVPALGAHWPAGTTLQLLQCLQGFVDHTLNPTQQWQLWNALQQMQQQWKPSVVAAAAAAAAAGHNNAVGTSAAAAPQPAAAAGGGASSTQPQQQQPTAGSPDDAMHPSVAFAAAAAAASLKAPAAPTTAFAAASTGAAAAGAGGMVRPRLPLNNSTLAATSGTTTAASPTSTSTSSSSVAAASIRGAAHQQHQQQLMRLVDELQDHVAAALAMVQPDPDALPAEVAPPRLPMPLHAMQAVKQTAADAGDDSTTAAARGGSTLAAAEGQRTQQQVLAAFAKAQKSLLNTHCSGAALTKVVEGLVLLLAVPRYAKAARKNQTVQRAVLRALEAAAWPDLLAQSMDLQQLLLLTAAASALDARSDGPYMQLLQQEVSRLLADAPLKLIAADLGRLVALQQPLFRPDVCLLKFWVGRLAQAARQTPEDALAVAVPLAALGFRPAAGAAALVLAPLLAAASESAAVLAGATPAAPNSSSGGASSSAAAANHSSRQPRLTPVGVLTLTRVLADMGLNPDTASAKLLLRAHVTLMSRYSVPQLLQLGRNVLSLGLLTTTAPSPSSRGSSSAASATSAAGVATAAHPAQQDEAGGSASSRCWLLQGAGRWLYVWLRNLTGRNVTQFTAAQVVELQLLLCELDLVPWHLARNRSEGVFVTLQQLQARLAAAPAAATAWQPALAAAIQASYHSTQELRRLVAARARQLAHNQQQRANAAASTPAGIRAAVAAAMQYPVVGPNSSEAYNAGEAYNNSSTRRFVSRRTVAAVGGAGVSPAAGAAAGAAGGWGVGAAFSYAANPVSQQLQQLTHQKRVLLWAALKHRAVQPLTPAWVESCCFNVLVGNDFVTPAVASGLLLAVAEVTRVRGVSPPQQKPSATAAAASQHTAELLMRESAFASLTNELVGRLLQGLQLLEGPLFVQALASLSTAGVRAADRMTTRVSVSPLLGGAASPPTAPPSSHGAGGRGAAAAKRPAFALSQRQCQQLLQDVLRALPGLQPSQLPLLVTSIMQLQLRPDVAWLSEALQALAIKAATAAAAGQPAQQLLLLAAAKQLLVCAGVLHAAPPAASSSPADSMSVVGSSVDSMKRQAAGRASATASSPQRGPAVVNGQPPSSSGVPAAVLPVAYALRALAAGAANVLSGLIGRGSHQQHNGSTAARAQRANGAAAATSAVAAAAAVAAAMSGGAVGAAAGSPVATGDRSVALLLSSLATQLQLARSGAEVAATSAGRQAKVQGSTSALSLPPDATAAAAFRAMQAHIQRANKTPVNSAAVDAAAPVVDTQQLLAAAVLLHAGSSSSSAAVAPAAGGSGVVSDAGSSSRSTPAQSGVRFGYDQKQHMQQQARQQQQQRLLLGQLLQLQLQKASQTLVESVWGANSAAATPTSTNSKEQQQQVPSAVDVYATQVLLDPTVDLLAPQQLEEEQKGAAQGSSGGSDTGSEQQQQQLLGMRPHRLVTQGLQVQFDGLLRKAFMAAAAAAAGGGGSRRRHSSSRSGEQDEESEDGPAVGGGMGDDGVGQRREPWWLPRPPANVSGLLQADASTTNSGGIGSGGVDGGAELQLVGVGSGAAAGVAAESEGRPAGSAGAGGEPVLVLPVMSRALDAQFARLMREVLHSSLAAGGGGRGGRGGSGLGGGDSGSL